MFISKKHIARRTFLKGAGVTLGLPLLEAMIPASTAMAQTAANATPRFMGIFYPHGMSPGWWEPSTARLSAQLPYIMEPLKNVYDQSVIFTGLWSRSAEPPEGTTGSDHWVAAAFMTAIKPRKTAGSDASVGTSTIDQQIAQRIGADSLLPSLQLAVEDPGTNSGNCGEGYSCAYTNSISWVEVDTPDLELEATGWKRTRPLPMELNPQVVFERLFGSGATPAVREARRLQSQSILDSVLDELSTLRSDLGANDRLTINQYTDEVREIERRLQLAATKSAAVPEMDEPAGIPADFDEHIKLHMDLVALAFQADITRVATLLGARDLTGKSYQFPRNEYFPEGGNSVSFHGGSHHQDVPANLEEYAQLNRYHVYTMAYLAEKLKSIPEGDRTLLDNSLIFYGTNMGNSNQHQHYDVPHILVGGAGGQLQGGRHLHYDRKTVTTGNLLLNIMDMYGVHREFQGDSTGRLSEL